MTLENVKKLNLPIAPGSYQFYNAKGEIIYIGKAANLKSRVLSYWRKSANHTPAKLAMLKEIGRVKWIITDSEIEALLLESNLIKKYQPRYNIDLRDDKRFNYIKVSLADEIPGVFLTRKIDRTGKYFGPFTSGLAARETLRALRKIFPYCTARKAQRRPCFYYQIGRCLGVCGGVIGRDDYLKRVIKPLIMFLAGRKNKIIKNLELRIKKLEKIESRRRKADGRTANAANGNTDNANGELANLKFQLKNMKYVLANAKVLSVGEKYANDTVELAKLLSLPKVPERIEGYDIANIFGKEAVGSLVVFSGGEPDKSQYRKFKIRAGQGLANDTGMLREVLERRFKHSPLSGLSPVIPLSRPFPRSLHRGRKGRVVPSPATVGAGEGQGGGGDSWPLPDLIIVDGGKAQLNAALRVLKKQKLEISLIAISKGLGLRSAGAPDKLFFPGESKPLELPLASPALHLIKRVRDEAHRFAIGYHRKLRNKREFF